MAMEISYKHRSGKEISFTQSAEMPWHCYAIWRFFDSHPECVDMDDEDVQQYTEMYFRKASLFQARQMGRPKDGMMNAIEYPTKQDCITMTILILQKEMRAGNDVLDDTIDIQDLQ